jgi:hypothetical protein
MVSHSDDFGRLSCDAFTVKHEVFPTSPRTEAEFDRALDAMHDSGLIVRYVVAGEQYAQIEKFEEHQTGLHKRTASKRPEPPTSDGAKNAESSDTSRAIPEIPSELNRSEEKGREGSATRAPLTLTKGQARMAVLDLVALWNRDIPAPLMVVTTDLQPASAARLTRALQARPSLAWWAARIAQVRESEFLTARRPGRDGEYFTADLWWLLENADKVESGRYTNRAAAKPVEVNGHTGPKVPTAAETRAMLDRKRQEAVRG